MRRGAFIRAVSRHHVVRFALVGSVNTAVYYAAFMLLDIVVPYFAAHSIAFLSALTVSLVLNSRYTFRTSLDWRKAALYPLTGLINYVVHSTGLVVGVQLLHAPALWATSLGAACAIPCTYLAVRLILTGGGDQQRGGAPVRTAVK
jgi:putative flippase GtrA